MIGDEDRSNDHLTFSQRNGYADLPEPMRLEHIPQKFKQAANVGLDEAIFMFGACASFAAYLTRKYRQQAGKPESSSV